MISEKLERELIYLKNETNNCFMKENKIKKLVFNLEKHRFKILYESDFLNKNCNLNIENINSNYKASFDKYLKLYIPEIILENKYSGNYAYKNMMLNIAKASKRYSGLYYGKKVFILVHFFDNNEHMENCFENKNIKCINDGLVCAKVIKDDSINNMQYSVYSTYSLNPHMEVRIFEAEKVESWISEIIEK